MRAVHMNHDQFNEIVRRLGEHLRLKDIFIYIYQSNYAELSLELSTALHEPFYALNELETLYIDAGFDIPLDITIVCNLTRACPRLRSWHAHWYQYRNTIEHCTISFDTFIRILQCCRDLRVLPETVCIDLSAPPSKESQSELGTHVYGPVLEVQDTEIALEVEDILSSLLPHVQRLHRPLLM
jgi:hypothetical protein